MNASRINLGLKMTTALLGAAACAVVGVGLFLPLDGAGESVQISAPLKPHPVSQRLPAIDSFAPIFSRTVQPAPTNVAAAPAQTETATTGAASAAAVIAQISLVGTIGDSIALLRGPDGTVQLAEVGDDVMGAPILAIRPSECDLRVSGKLKTLRIVPKPEDHTITPVNTAEK